MLMCMTVSILAIVLNLSIWDRTELKRQMEGWLWKGEFARCLAPPHSPPLCPPVLSMVLSQNGRRQQDSQQNTAGLTWREILLWRGWALETRLLRLRLHHFTCVKWWRRLLKGPLPWSHRLFLERSLLLVIVVRFKSSPLAQNLDFIGSKGLTQYTTYITLKIYYI